jgi:hypothetical protein
VRSSGLDLVKELRLRNWARSNYAPPGQRSAAWHPVVLEEMRQRDLEIADETREPARNYVPLPPMMPGLRSEPGEDPAALPPSPHVYF